MEEKLKLGRIEGEKYEWKERKRILILIPNLNDSLLLAT